MVTTVQSAMRRPALTRSGGLIVADECHRYGAETYSLALNSNYDWRLGLTATLERGDGGDEILCDYFGGVCFDLDYQRATADELIAPFKFALASVPLSAEERQEYDELDTALKTTRLSLIERWGVPESPIAEFLKGVSALAEDRTLGGGGGLGRFYLARFARRKSLLAETRMKFLALAGLSPAVGSSGGTIVFTQTQDAAGSAADVLISTGCTAAAVHSELGADEREQRLENLQQGKLAALAAPRILDEGIDVPDADLGIVMASNRSRRQMIQRLGRVLRKRGRKVAGFVVLYAENTVEDPHASGHLPDFYDDCLPWAQKHAQFSLGEGQLPELLEFLGVAADQGTSGVMRAITDAATPSRDAVEPGLQLAAGGEEPEPDPTPEVSAGQDDRYARFTEPPLGMFGKISDDPVADYLHAAGRYPLLSAAEEVHLAKAIEAGLYAAHLLETGDPPEWELLQRVSETGDFARQWMIVSNLRLVVHWAKRHTNHGLEFLDLIQAGTLGLIRAVDKFDFLRGHKFSTYATWWIQQSLTRTLADESSLIRMPVHFVDKLKQVERIRATSGQTWSEFLREHPDGVPDVASSEELVRMARLSRPIVSTDWLAEQVEDSWQGVQVGRTDIPVDEQVTDTLHQTMTVQRIFSFLDERRPGFSFVLRCRFGFQTGEPETLDAIGKRLGRTRERVRQIEAKALALIRGQLGVLGTPGDQAQPEEPANQAPPRKPRPSSKPVRNGFARRQTEPPSFQPARRAMPVDAAESQESVRGYQPRRLTLWYAGRNGRTPLGRTPTRTSPEGDSVT